MSALKSGMNWSLVKDELIAEKPNKYAPFKGLAVLAKRIFEVIDEEFAIS
jgi:hypothetical protein